MLLEVLINQIEHDIGKRGRGMAWSQSMLMVNIVLVSGYLQWEWWISHILGGDGGQSDIRRTAGTATVDMIPSTRIYSKQDCKISDE